MYGGVCMGGGVCAARCAGGGMLREANSASARIAPSPTHTPAPSGRARSLRAQLFGGRHEGYSQAVYAASHCRMKRVARHGVVVLDARSGVTR